MIIYSFRDIDADDIFAFSTDLTGTNIPPVTQTTDWLFHEALDPSPANDLNKLRKLAGFQDGYLNSRD